MCWQGLSLSLFVESQRPDFSQRCAQGFQQIAAKRAASQRLRKCADTCLSICTGLSLEAITHQYHGRKKNMHAPCLHSWDYISPCTIFRSTGEIGIFFFSLLNVLEIKSERPDGAALDAFWRATANVCGEGCRGRKQQTEGLEEEHRGGSWRQQMAKLAWETMTWSGRGFDRGRWLAEIPPEGGAEAHQAEEDCSRKSLYSLEYNHMILLQNNQQSSIICSVIDQNCFVFWWSTPKRGACAKCKFYQDQTVVKLEPFVWPSTETHNLHRFQDPKIQICFFFFLFLFLPLPRRILQHRLICRLKVLMSAGRASLWD